MNKVVWLLVSLYLAISTGYGQSFPTAMKEKHELVAGTNIHLIPPPSFTATDQFKGFQNPVDPTSMIMVVEIPGPLKQVTAGFTSEMMATRGMTLNNKTAIMIAGMKGLFVEMEQAANGMIFSKHILVFGDATKSTMINGVYLKDSLTLGEAIKQSIFTTYMDVAVEADPRAALSFDVDEKVGSLQFYAVVGNSMLFNRDLKTPTESEDQATLIVDKSFAAIDISNKKDFCVDRLEQYPDDYAIDETKGVQTVTIDGLHGYELYATNIKNASEEALYQVILFDDTGYYIIVATYTQGYTKALADLQRIIMTFRLK